MEDKFQRCVDSYAAAPLDCAYLLETAIVAMAQSAETFDHWRIVYYAAKDEYIEGLAFNEAIELARTFGEWLWIYLETREDAIKNLAIVNLASLANNPFDATDIKDKEYQKLWRWRRIFELCELWVEDIAVERIEEEMYAEKRRQEKRS